MLFCTKLFWGGTGRCRWLDLVSVLTPFCLSPNSPMHFFSKKWVQNVSNKLKIDIFFHIFVVKVFSLAKLDGSPSCWGAFILD